MTSRGGRRGRGGRAGRAGLAAVAAGTLAASTWGAGAWGAGGVAAQPPPAAGPSPAAPRSELGAGEPRVIQRTEVEVRVDSGPGVDGARLLDWAEAVGQQAAAVRRCYAERVEQVPALEGQLRLSVEARPGRRAPAVRAARDELDDAVVLRCASRALARARVRDVRHRETVFVGFTFRHSESGAGRALAAAADAFAESLETTALPSGGVSARGSSGNGLVRYDARADAEGDARRLAQLAHRRLPALFDCRRRAGRRGESPAGTVELELTLDAAGPVHARLVGSTVAPAGAGECVARAFEARPSDVGGGAARGTLTVAFAEAPAAP